ncbi:Uncharacterised protein [BD1-7 clade bacterium]|uniref:DNA gyrase subunit B n=1 Tax=BD1-7 clade bacterium TaxID=2029982 RepID=A0A5S9PUJ2_9GAMM|nr:Uncharacterised protein [BD1-7 clade bacterium]
MLKAVFNGILVVLTLLYPVAVYLGLQTMEPRGIALILLVLFGLRIILGIASKTAPKTADTTSEHKNRIQALQLPLIVGTIFIAIVAALNSKISLLFYPVVINSVMLTIFAATLAKPPSMIERLARLTEPDLPAEAIPYTRNVTVIWCLFFIINGSIALYTALYSTIEVWSLYNGLISYIAMGLLFAIEFIVRMYIKRAHNIHRPRYDIEKTDFKKTDKTKTANRE